MNDLNAKKLNPTQETEKSVNFTEKGRYLTVETISSISH